MRRVGEVANVDQPDEDADDRDNLGKRVYRRAVRSGGNETSEL